MRKIQHPTSVSKMSSRPMIATAFILKPTAVSTKLAFLFGRLDKPCVRHVEVRRHVPLWLGRRSCLEQQTAKATILHLSRVHNGSQPRSIILSTKSFLRFTAPPPLPCCNIPRPGFYPSVGRDFRGRCWLKPPLGIASCVCLRRPCSAAACARASAASLFRFFLFSLRFL